VHSDLCSCAPYHLYFTLFHCSYAGVFDGHGAPDAAELAARRMHKLLAEELGASANE
jgi:serine/threonine protein phosphatase PrpC